MNKDTASPPPKAVELIADEFRRFLREEGARDRPWDFANGLARVLTEEGFTVLFDDLPLCPACEIRHGLPLHYDGGAS